MKKFLIILLFSVIGFAQTEKREVYSGMMISNKGEKQYAEVENVLFFNYSNEPVIKMYLYDGTVHFYKRITDEYQKETETCELYTISLYEEKESRVLVQRFDTGCRIFISEEVIVEFYKPE